MPMRAAGGDGRGLSGVLVAGDRRATAGNVIVHDRADKVLCVDDRAVLALSGAPANAYEIARLLEISFQHYRRTQLQELSLDGRLRTLSRLLRDNLTMAMQGIGAVVPIYATYEHARGRGTHAAGGKIFFYDILGATFESVDFCTTGSGGQLFAVPSTIRIVGTNPSLIVMNHRLWRWW